MVDSVYRHTNIISNDWRRLSQFYQKVFGCKPVPPQRNQSGDWLAQGTAVKNASLEGEHLLLPGAGENGPTLEIYQYHHVLDKPEPAANRSGFSHIAFEVKNVEEALNAVVNAGGSTHGGVVSKEVPGVGLLTFTYAKDPDSNLIELQAWT